MQGKDLSILVRNCVLRGIVAAVILFLILWGIALLPVSNAMESALHLASLYMVVLVAGYTLHRVSVLTKGTHQGSRLYNLGTAAGMLISGFGFWQALTAFKDFQAWPGKDGLIIFSGIIGLAISRLAEYRGERSGNLWWGIVGWLEGAPTTKVLIGLAAGFYFMYIRPWLAIDNNILVIFEWFMVGILSFVILVRTMLGISRSYASQEPEVKLSKHQPKVEGLTGTTHDYMIRVERQFVNTGEETGLYVLLIILLYNNGVSERYIVEAVRPLTNFLDARDKWYEVGLLHRRAVRRRVRWRKEILKSSIESVNSLVQHHRSGIPGSSYGDISLDELRQHFLETGDKAGLFVRLTLLLHKTGRHQEHIVATLRSMFDDIGRLYPKELEDLIDRFKENIIVAD
jgi:hypothetical protein